MSSFIIDKREFIKIAGLLAGLQNNEAHNSEKSIYWWNPEAMKLHDDESIMALMASCWRYNALSVCRQYNDPISSLEAYKISDKEKTALFNEYKKIGLKIINSALAHTSELQNYFYALLKFTSSYNYQTEDEVMNEAGMSILQEALYLVAKKAFFKEYEASQAWGEFTTERKEAVWDSDFWAAYTN